MLSEKARVERNKYIREWRSRNPSRVKTANERYWEKRAARLAAEKGDAIHVAENADN